ncbi:MAG: hypothetical protein PHU06_05110 [Gallionella sp.]|nr:hypothetical protein [Gallionella sp.]MDD4957996.1 hypothetical protein [Gallionella sp.]
MLDFTLDAVGLLIESLKRNPPIRRIVIALALAILALTAALAISTTIFSWPLPFELASNIFPPLIISAIFMLFLGLAAYTGLKVKGGGMLELELQSLHEERKRITQRLADTPRPDILDTIQLSLNQLNEYYTINKSQARNSFTFSVFAIIVGLATLLGGIWIFYLRETPRVELTAITSIAGILTQFIGGLIFTYTARVRIS